MKESRLPYAIIGCGGIARAHLNGLRLLREAGLHKVDLVAVCDVVAENARSFADQAEAFLGRQPQVFTDWDKFFQTYGYVAINDCTPTFQHHLVSLADRKSVV